MMPSRITAYVFGIAFTGGTAALAPVGPTFDLSWYTIDGGGEMFSTGGDFELSGTIGQPDAGDPMTGGDFELTGGFWAIGSTSSTCDSCDMNCDGVVDALDIEGFLQALFDPENFQPDCDPTLADINQDGAVNAFDIEPFIELLFP